MITIQDLKKAAETLGLWCGTNEINLSEGAVKKAFKKLALKYHPDKNPGTEELFKEIHNAYEALSDKSNRETLSSYIKQVNSNHKTNVSSSSQPASYKNPIDSLRNAIESNNKNLIVQLCGHIKTNKIIVPEYVFIDAIDKLKDFDSLDLILKTLINSGGKISASALKVAILSPLKLQLLEPIMTGIKSSGNHVSIEELSYAIDKNEPKYIAEIFRQVVEQGIKISDNLLIQMIQSNIDERLLIDLLQNTASLNPVLKQYLSFLPDKRFVYLGGFKIDLFVRFLARKCNVELGNKLIDTFYHAETPRLPNKMPELHPEILALFDMTLEMLEREPASVLADILEANLSELLEQFYPEAIIKKEDESSEAFTERKIICKTLFDRLPKLYKQALEIIARSKRVDYESLRETDGYYFHQTFGSDAQLNALIDSFFLQRKSGIGRIKVLRPYQWCSILQRQVGQHGHTKGGNYERTEHILYHGAAAYLNLEDSYPFTKETPIQYAAEYNQFEFIKLFVKYGASVNSDNHRNSPLHSSIIHRAWESIRFLIEHGALIKDEDIQLAGKRLAAVQVEFLRAEMRTQREESPILVSEPKTQHEKQRAETTKRKENDSTSGTEKDDVSGSSTQPSKLRKTNTYYRASAHTMFVNHNQPILSQQKSATDADKSLSEWLEQFSEKKVLNEEIDSCEWY